MKTQFALVDDHDRPPTEAIDLGQLPPTVDIVTAARILGVGRTVAYELVREGAWPTPVIHVGRKIRVPTAPLLTLLGVGATIAKSGELHVEGRAGTHCPS